MCAISLSFSFLESAFSLNSLSLLIKAVGFLISLYSMVEVEGVHLSSPRLTSFYSDGFWLLRGILLEFWIKNFLIC